MRFMLFMYPSDAAEIGVMPTAEAVAEMTKFNEELIKSGALLAGDGLQPSSKGARVYFGGGKPRVQDGPFTESKEIIGGYWILQCKSKAEAVEWARRCPAGDAKFIEVRQVFEMTDFPQDVQDAADTPIIRASLGKTAAN